MDIEEFKRMFNDYTEVTTYSIKMEDHDGEVDFLSAGALPFHRKHEIGERIGVTLERIDYPVFLKENGKAQEYIPKKDSYNVISGMTEICDISMQISYREKLIEVTYDIDLIFTKIHDISGFDKK